MVDLIRYPSVVFLGTGLALWLAGRLGLRLSRRYPLDDEMRQDFSLVQGAALTLLGLITAFSFSMASGRYDQRKNLEAAEANAIGTEYIRASLLPPADAARLRSLLKAYIDERLLYFEAFTEDSTGSVNARATGLQQQLWAAVLGPAAATPTPVVALVVSGMSEVLNAQAYTQAAWWYRIPTSAWILMIVIALGCNILVGYGARSIATANRVLFIVPIFTAIAFGFIADIDSPRHGIIRIVPQNMLSLASSLPSS
jgi:hypothetical protein